MRRISRFDSVSGTRIAAGSAALCVDVVEPAGQPLQLREGVSAQATASLEDRLRPASHARSNAGSARRLRARRSRQTPAAGTAAPARRCSKRWFSRWPSASTDIERMHPAASSMASGMPSRRQHVSAVADAFCGVTTKCGRSRRARSANSRADSCASSTSRRMGRCGSGTDGEGTHDRQHEAVAAPRDGGDGGRPHDLAQRGDLAPQRAVVHAHLGPHAFEAFFLGDQMTGALHQQRQHAKPPRPQGSALHRRPATGVRPVNVRSGRTPWKHKRRKGRHRQTCAWLPAGS